VVIVSAISHFTREIRLSQAEEPGHHRPMRALENRSASRLGLSARAYHRVLEVARTIADLAGATAIAGSQVAEAIQYRRFDRL